MKTLGEEKGVEVNSNFKITAKTELTVNGTLILRQTCGIVEVKN